MNGKKNQLKQFMYARFKSCPRYSGKTPVSQIVYAKGTHVYTLLEIHEIYRKHEGLYSDYVAFCSYRNVEMYDESDFYYWISILSVEQGIHSSP
jgi:hypothetical protein